MLNTNLLESSIKEGENYIFKKYKRNTKNHNAVTKKEQNHIIKFWIS